MPRVSRRTAIVAGLTVAAASTLPIKAKAAMYGPDEGEPLEGIEGIRLITLSERATMIPGFKTAKLLDLVVQPGATFPVTAMDKPMICHLIEGELQITNNGETFTAKKNEVWTCNAGGTEGAENTAGEPAVMRVAQLIA